MLKKITLGTGALIIAATAVFAGGHDKTPEQTAIGARQAHMSLYSHNLGLLGGMAQGKIDYDSGAASAAASNLAALASMNQSRYWLPNTDNGNEEGTRALPALWSDMAGVGKIAGEFGAAVTAMEAAAGVDLASLQGAMGPLGGACGACHKAFRAPAN